MLRRMNPNDYVRIKPTAAGWKAIHANIDAFNATYGHITKQKYPEPDEHGYIKDQFWCLMQYFDWSKFIGMGMPFTDMQIVGEE